MTKTKQTIMSMLFASVFATVLTANVHADETSAQKLSLVKQEDDFPRFQIGFEKEAVRLSAYKMTDGSDEESLRLGGGFHIMPNGYELPSVTLGYRITDRVFVGSKVEVDMYGSLDKDIRDEDNGLDRSESKYLGLSVSPHLSYWFGSGTVRPFLKAEATFSTLTGESRYRMTESNESNEERHDRWKNKSTEWGVGGAVGGGVHFFVGEHISLDVSLLGGYGFHKYKSRREYHYEGYDGDLDNQIDTSQPKFHHWELSGNLGISGWI